MCSDPLDHPLLASLLFVFVFYPCTLRYFSEELLCSQPLKLHGIYYEYRTLHMLLLNFRKFVGAFFKLVEISE